MLVGRHHQVLAVTRGAAAGEGDRVEHDVRDPTFVDGQAQQRGRAVHRHDAQVGQAARLHAEQDPARRFVGGDQHHGFAADAHALAVEVQLHAFRAVAEVVRAFARDEGARLGLDALAPAIQRLPTNEVGALARHGQLGFAAALGVRARGEAPDELGVLAALEPFPARPVGRVRRRREVGVARALALQLGPGPTTPRGVAPDLVALLTEQHEFALDGDAGLVRVARFELDREVFAGVVDAVLRAQVHRVGRPTGAHGAGPADLAARGVDHARDEGVLERGVAEGLRRELDAGDTFLVGDELQGRQVLAGSPAVVVVRPEVPGVPALRDPGRRVVPRVHVHLDLRAGDRSAEGVLRAHLGVDRLAEPEGARGTVVLRRGDDLDAELGQLVLFEAEERRGAEALLRVVVEELHVVRTERPLRSTLDRSGGAAEVVQLDRSFRDEVAARVGQAVAQRVTGRRRVDVRLAQARRQLPLHFVAGTIGRAIGRRVQLPLAVAVPAVVAPDDREGLVLAGAHRGKGLAASAAEVIEAREAVRVGRGRATLPGVVVVAAVKQRHLRFRARSPVGHVRGPRDHAVTEVLQCQRELGDQQQLTADGAVRTRLQEVGAGRDGFGDLDQVPAVPVRAVVAGRVRPRAHRARGRRAEVLEPLVRSMILRRELHVASQVDRRQAQVHAGRVAPAQAEDLRTAG